MMTQRTLRILVIDGAGAREEEADLDLKLELDWYTDGTGKPPLLPLLSCCAGCIDHAVRMMIGVGRVFCVCSAYF